jgi:uncharacterized protein YbbC (DUF1343 family)
MSVWPGIDVLLDQQLDMLAGRRIGLVTNAGSVTRQLTGSVEALRRTGVAHLTALFVPEHGFYVAAPAAAGVASTVDEWLGLPVFSLYGEARRPTAAMLDGLDLLLVDIQSVGARFYTYLTTLLYVLQAAAAHHRPVIVCDRPNPIGGEIIEGPLLEPGFESFVGCGPLPVRSGLTIGEVAKLYVEVWGVECDLTLIPCRGWRRAMWFDETGLVWIPPSPNLPKVDTAVLYPGTCLIEGTNLSEGRGTALPFEVVGAPWLDGRTLAQAMNELRLPGIGFRPVWFEPTAGKWAGQRCCGVQLHVLDRQALRPVTVVLHLIATIKMLHPAQFAWQLPHFDHLIGTDQVRLQLDAEVAVNEIIAGWLPGQTMFMEQRKTILLYQESQSIIEQPRQGEEGKKPTSNNRVPATNISARRRR